MFDIAEQNQKVMEQFGREAAQKHRTENPVLDVFHALQDYTSEFENTLDESHEVGARLVSFGNAITFHVRQIGYSQPSIITFDGVTDEGNHVRLVQHISQLSVLLIALPVRPDQPKKPIGFVNN